MTNFHNFVVLLNDCQPLTIHFYASLLLINITFLMDCYQDLTLVHIYKVANASTNHLVKYNDKNNRGILFWDSPPDGLSVILLTGSTNPIGFFFFVVIFSFLSICIKQKYVVNIYFLMG